MTSTIEGLDVLRRWGDRLAAFPEVQARASITALNYVADYSREDLTGALHADTGLPAARLQYAMAVRRATQRRPGLALLVADSTGVPVREYRYQAQPVTGGHGTRARILVDFPGVGRKIAAGFINPKAHSGRPQPLATRNSYATQAGGVVTRWARPTPAIGPSVAAAVKAAVRGTRAEHYQALLLAHFERRLIAEWKKA
ncbi:hypothetical protein [Plasticicumulans acidivorans]|uniref:Prophage minor tail protein Z (GPZ) n=1 Tax=Plasticicumulans acidivorans TaxID=886464 RepID=A0A317N0A3_9GAMM|nr:hypothetical protein [Plasticicumulans acidivorans]PWV66001.1 hypothetical protein C7443_101489 [Plasticicumulans acidivorans]